MKAGIKEIKTFCKFMKLKFEQQTDFGFIGSCLSDVKAGMKVDMLTGKITDYKIITIGKRRIYFDLNTFSDGRYIFQ